MRSTLSTTLAPAPTLPRAHARAKLSCQLSVGAVSTGMVDYASGGPGGGPGGEPAESAAGRIQIACDGIKDKR